MSTVVEPLSEADLPDRYEVVNGQVVELPPMSALSSEVANRIHERLVLHAQTARSGRPRMDMLFRVPLPRDPGRNRKPDVAFVSFDRWPDDRPMPYQGDPFDVVTDLVVEVVSPTDEAEDLLVKTGEYLQSGVRMVWLVYLRLRRVEAHTVRRGAPKVYNETDTLDGGEVLPGFAAPMAALFPLVTGVPETKSDE